MSKYHDTFMLRIAIHSRYVLYEVRVPYGPTPNLQIIIFNGLVCIGVNITAFGREITLLEFFSVKCLVFLQILH